MGQHEEPASQVKGWLGLLYFNVPPRRLLWGRCGSGWGPRSSSYVNPANLLIALKTPFITAVWHLCHGVMWTLGFMTIWITQSIDQSFKTLNRAMLAGQLTLTQYHVTPEPRRNRATQLQSHDNPCHDKIWTKNGSHSLFDIKYFSAAPW
jgi:hypothetical protein